MKILFAILCIVTFASCAPATKFYIVRHAEKKSSDGGNMSATDPELSEAGLNRAADLAAVLKAEKITQVFVTNTRRSKSTAAPTAQLFGLSPEIYRGTADSAFIARLKSANGAVLIVGHSNTVGPIVNRLSSTATVTADLPESVYNCLYIITRRKSRYTVREQTYGAPTP